MKSKKQWLIVGISAIIVAIGAGCFFYFSNQAKVFTKPEYIKEVVVQNENFNDVLDEFLDLTTSYIKAQSSKRFSGAFRKNDGHIQKVFRSCKYV